MKKRLSLLLTPLLLTLPLMSFPAPKLPWKFECGFVIQSTKSLEQGNLNPDELILLKCKDRTQGLPKRSMVRKRMSEIHNRQIPYGTFRIN